MEPPEALRPLREDAPLASPEHEELRAFAHAVVHSPGGKRRASSPVCEPAFPMPLPRAPPRAPTPEFSSPPGEAAADGGGSLASWSNTDNDSSLALSEDDGCANLELFQKWFSEHQR